MQPSDDDTADAVLTVIDDLRPTVSVLAGFLTLFTAAHLGHDQAQFKDACLRHCATLARQTLSRLNQWENLYTPQDSDPEGGAE
jgi:hypothetical protein